jgi:GcrA cell cycle regulator
MLANQPTWTAERVELLKLRFEAGLSCREIAQDIGVSRNAVIGKLSRLNLSCKESREPRRPVPRDATKRARPKAASRRSYSLSLKMYAGQQPMVEEEPIYSGPGCSLLELSEQRCRWPISTPGAEDFCFCGNTPAEGVPYCAGHSRLAYRTNVSPSRRGRGWRLACF